MEVGVIIAMLLLMLALLFAGLEIAFALGLAGLLGLFLWQPGLKSLEIAGLTAWNGTNNFILVALPLFVFMSAVLHHSGISDNLFEGVSRWLNWLPGALAVSSVAACGIFAALSGSSTATAATIGLAAIPEMEKRGYERRFSLGAVAAGGTLGIMIPPSLALIIYGFLTDQSIGRLFIAGIIPGMILALLFMSYTVLLAYFKPGIARRAGYVTWRERLASLPQFLPPFLIILLVIGSIYAGVVTITEAAALGAFLSCLVALFYRKLDLNVLRQAGWEAARTTAMLLLIMIGGMIITHALARIGFGTAVTQAIEALRLSPWLVFAFIVGVYLIMGMLLDPLSMMIITLPFFFPVVQAMGFDPIWFGIVLVILIETGLITPPVGLNLFVIQGISGSRLEEVALGSLPYVLVMLLVIVLLSFFPTLALWLPSTMFR